MVRSLARKSRRALTLLLATVLVTGVTGAVPALASGPPGDEPLPGYTIRNPPLDPLVIDGQPTTVLQGVHGHAAYTIEVPADWNGELAMWAHGYRGTGRVLTVDPPGYGLRTLMLEQGYAWAASSYYANGYHVRAGVLSTRDLARVFAERVDEPERIYIAGVSMGGHVIGRSLEQYPGFYAGALPMCGVLGDHELFDFFLDYQLVSQALAGVRAYPPPKDYLERVVPRIQDELGMTELKPGGPDTLNARGEQFRAIMINRSGGPRPGAKPAFAFWKDFLFGLAVNTSGESLAEDPSQVATNFFTFYRPREPERVNFTVQRVFPENLIARYSPRLTQIPRIKGTPHSPVLTLHGLGDLFVPFSMEQAYARDVARRGDPDLLVQRAIRTVNHCEFSPTEVGTAWRDLVQWVETGERPAGNAVRDPRVVSDPNYGCRFTDQAAYRDPPSGSTRRLFAPCP